MNRRDAWLLNLYDGKADGNLPDGFDTVGEDDAMREMKVVLEALPPKVPDAKTIDAVLAAAREEAVPHGARRDRGPARRPRSVGLRVGALSVVAVLLIGLLGVLRQDVFLPHEPTALDSSQAAASSPRSVGDPISDRSPGRHAVPQEEPAYAPIVSRWEDVPPASRGRIEGQTGSAPRGLYTPVDGGTESTETLSWDDQQTVIDLHQRIEMIGTGVARGWETPSVPLEMLATEGTDNAVIPATQRR